LTLFTKPYRATVIDEIELAQQIGRSGHLASIPNGARYLSPHLHILSAASNTHLERKQWVGKLREAKDAISNLEGKVICRIDALEQVGDTPILHTYMVQHNDKLSRSS
jgi:hypothetical protein